MENTLMFFTAVCGGIAGGMLALYVLRGLSGVELEHKTKFERPIPLLIKLLYPLLPLVRRWAGCSGLANLRRIADTKLQMSGYYESISAVDFLGLRILFAIAGILLIFCGLYSSQPVGCLVVGGMLMIYPGAWINTVIKKRHNSIMKALPNVLDLLTLSVESGKDLVSALRDILARRKMDDLGEELMHAFQEMQLGRKRSEALRAMAARVRQVDLTATINAIVQAEELGVSIAQLLRIQGDTQRAKRFAMAEKQANEAPVKIIIPVVVFILPAVFIILIGPLIVTTIAQFR